MKIHAVTRFVGVLVAAKLLLGAPAREAWAERGKRPPAAAPVEGVVNLNTATQAELELLPGVGRKKALAILEWRRRHGSFRRVEDLRRVKGFGRRTVNKLKPYLALKGPTTLRRRR